MNEQFFEPEELRARRTMATDSYRILLVAQIVASTLYLGMVFLAGFWTYKPEVWILAILTAGISYLNCIVLLAAPKYRWVAIILVICSILSGALAGIFLLW